MHSKQWNADVFFGYISHEFLRKLQVLCHICNSEIHLSGDFHNLVVTALYEESTVQFIWFRSVKMSNEPPSIEGISVMPMLRNILLSQSCLPEVWFDIRCQLTVYLHLYIWMSVCSWQMASVSHLYSCLFTDEMVSNVFSVAFRSVMMIHSYVWEKICIYFCTEKI